MWRRVSVPLILLSLFVLIAVSRSIAQVRRGRTTLRPVKPVTTTLTVRPSMLCFSTEEDFLCQGPTPSDGIKLISDGDLLLPNGQVFRRNRELLLAFEIRDDLGLDAADVLRVDPEKRESLTVFSTELDDPRGKFTAGDLLTTEGGVLPNAALLAAFSLPTRVDLGLDAVHFVGKIETIINFVHSLRDTGRDWWLENPNALASKLKEMRIDIWFSTEGTAPTFQSPKFLDGDLLSATGTIIARNGVLLPNTVPAGLPSRGVDFGLDALVADRSARRERIHFSTEILYRGRVNFTDGDVIRINNGVAIPNATLIKMFKPRAQFLGLDALSFMPRR